MDGMVRQGRKVSLAAALAVAVIVGPNVQSALAFCVRNDTGGAIYVEALDDTAAFVAEIANNKKTCCYPKDESCALGDADVKLSITAPEGGGSCAVSVGPKGNINVTGKPDALKCKANKAGSTMDWASG